MDYSYNLVAGWMYTLWAGVQLISGGLTMLVWWKGAQWRQESENREAELAKCLDLATVSTAQSASKL